MSENRPRLRDGKLGLIAPISIAIVTAIIILGAVLLTHRPEAPPEPAPIPPVPAPAATPASVAKPDDLVLNRSELVEEASAIAAAYAEAGNVAPKGRDPLVGRRFVLRIPFGCEGPQVGAGVAQAFYEFDADARTVRLVARPAIWTNLPLIQELDGAGIEAAEGFWIPQPWRLSDTCAARSDKPVPAAPTPAAAQTLGLAQVFKGDDSRVSRRRDRPYEHVLKLAANERLPLTDGFRLVLEGRFSTFPSGRVARCWSESPDHRPICLYAIELERVAFEAGGDGALIAEWRG